jgi:hypothetical protein
VPPEITVETRERTAPNRNSAVDGDRGDRGVDPAAVRQARVDHRRRLVDPPPDPGDDAVDDPQQVVVVAEPDRRDLQLATALDIDLERAVDQDVGDRVVLEQRLDRPKPDHLVEHRGAQLVEFGGVQRQPLGAGEVAHQPAHLPPHLRLVELVELGEVDLLDQLAMQLQPHVEQIVVVRQRRRRRVVGRIDVEHQLARRRAGRRLVGRVADHQPRLRLGGRRLTEIEPGHQARLRCCGAAGW